MKILLKKYSINPILTPRVEEGSFDKACVYNAAAIARDNKVYLLYRGEERYYQDYISRAGLAISADGFNFKRYGSDPIMDLDKDKKEEARGCEDFRVIEDDDGKYFMTYTAYEGFRDGIYYVSLRGALSDNLVEWEKIGAIIPGREKSGAIVQNYKYNNEYVMYFGEGVLKLAFSKNLRTWRVEERPVLEPRKGYFDDFLVEGGPPPIITSEGILAIYNSAKGAMGYGGKMETLSYNVGFAIFDKNDPRKILYRTDVPILEPTEYWEKYGKINYVVFTNALVRFRNKWLLYYGGADKSIGVAEVEFLE